MPNSQKYSTFIETVSFSYFCILDVATFTKCLNIFINCELFLTIFGVNQSIDPNISVRSASNVDIFRPLHIFSFTSFDKKIKGFAHKSFFLTCSLKPSDLFIKYVLKPGILSKDIYQKRLQYNYELLDLMKRSEGFKAILSRDM